MHHSYIHPSGLTVHHQLIAASPLTSIQLWFDVGSIDDPKNHEGTSHFLEHMLFKGSRNDPKGNISENIEKLGGEINAFTTFDHTAIHLTVLTQGAETALGMICDAGFSPALDGQQVESERKVILEEIFRNLDDSNYRFGAAVQKEIYRGHPLSHPITGTPESVKLITQQSMREFCEEYFTPENARLVIVGGMSADEAQKSLDEIFVSSLPELACQRRAKKNRLLPSLKNRRHSDSQGPVALVVASDLSYDRVELIFTAPAFADRDCLPLSIAAFILAQSDSAPLNNFFCEHLKVATQTNCSLNVNAYAGTWSITAIPGEGKLGEVITAFQKFIERLRSGEFFQKYDMEIIKSSYKVERLLELQTVEQRAASLGGAAGQIGGLFYSDHLSLEIEQVTIDAVQKAVERWVSPDSAVLAVLSPSPREEVLEKTKLWSQTKSSEDSSSIAEKKHPALPPKTQSSQITKIPLSNGHTLIHLKRSELALTSLVAVAEGGLRAEEKGQAGFQSFAATLTGQQTSDMSQTEFNDFLNKKAAQVEGFSGKDSTGLQMLAMSENFDEIFSPALKSFFEFEISPSFFELTRSRFLQSIDAQYDHPSALAMAMSQRKIFGQHHYSRMIHGLREDIENMESKALQDQFRHYCSTNKWVFSVVSDIPAERIAASLEQLIEKLMLKGGRFRPTLCQHQFPDPDIKGAGDRQQSHSISARSGPTWAVNQRDVYDLLSAIIGGGGGSLFKKIRDELGLVYTVTPLLICGKEKGMFGTYFAASHENKQKAVDAIQKENALYRKVGFSEEDLLRGRLMIKAQEASEKQHLETVSLNLALREVLGGSAEDYWHKEQRIEGISLHDFNEKAAEIFDENAWSWVHVEAPAGEPTV
jgi:zinc protease